MTGNPRACQGARKHQLDGLDIYVAGKATVNFVFDRYMDLKKAMVSRPSPQKNNNNKHLMWWLLG